MRAAHLLVLALALAAPAAALAASSEPELAQLERAAAEHPEDAALARSLARVQLERGEVDAAIESLRAHARRNPHQRGELAQVLGRALYAKGELPQARTALREAIAHRERDALAHFFLGLVLVREGQRDEGARELARARALDPSLEARVRSASRGEPSALTRIASRIALAVGTGVEYDTNSTLEGDEDITNLPGDSADARLSTNAAIGVRLFRDERSEISAGYRFDDSRHEDLDSLDVQSHAAWFSGGRALAARWIARAEGGVAQHRLDGDAYLETATFGSGIAFRSERSSLVELRIGAERRAYADTPALPSLERDGWRVASALRHSSALRLWAPSVLTTQLSYARTLSDGERDLFGFAPAFESHAGGLDVTLRAPLPLEFRLETRLGLAIERFDARNVIDFLSDDGVGDPNPDRRRDYAVDGALSLVRPLSRFLELELRARETRHFSNIDLYDWDRQIFGSYLRFRWQPQ